MYNIRLLLKTKNQVLPLLDNYQYIYISVSQMFSRTEGLKDDLRLFNVTVERGTRADEVAQFEYIPHCWCS